MTYTKTSIINIALGHLGMAPLLDFDDELIAKNPSAIVMDTYYDMALNETLSEHRWKFASTQEALIELEDLTILGWNYVYEYTSSMAAVWNVYNEATIVNKENQEFEVVHNIVQNGKIICSDLESAYADYTRKITDVTLWDDKFVDAFTYKLAAKCAHRLIGDPAIGLKLTEIYYGLILEAKRIGFSEKRKKPNQESGYVNARG